MLFSLVNNETAFDLVMGQNLGRQGDRTELWEEESRVREMPLILHLRQMLVRIFPDKPLPHGDCWSPYGSNIDYLFSLTGLIKRCKE